jgi:protein-disulfide isomerase
MRRANLVAAALTLASAACGASDTSEVFEPRLAAIAGQSGLDVVAWQTCRSDPAMASRVNGDLSLAGTAGVHATPTFAVNGTLLVGAQPAAAFRTALDAARARAQASGVPAALYYESAVPQIPLGTSPVRGPADAWITIVEFSDFQCPFCATVQATLATVLPEYGTDVRVVFKNYPLTFHTYARTTAIAAECAHEQGRFWQFHDLVFGGRSALFDGL